jgi:hypothetical protein
MGGKQIPGIWENPVRRISPPPPLRHVPVHPGNTAHSIPDALPYRVGLSLGWDASASAVHISAHSGQQSPAKALAIMDSYSQWGMRNLVGQERLTVLTFARWAYNLLPEGQPQPGIGGGWHRYRQRSRSRPTRCRSSPAAARGFPHSTSRRSDYAEAASPRLITLKERLDFLMRIRRAFRYFWPASKR